MKLNDMLCDMDDYWYKSTEQGDDYSERDVMAKIY